MPSRVRSCKLIVEGDGDQQAVPELLRRHLYAIGDYVFQVRPNPIKAGKIRGILNAGKFERLVPHAMNDRDADAVLIILDTDEDCPVDLVRESARRLEALAAARRKPVGLCFLKAEYETLFLYSLASLRAGYGAIPWRPDPPPLPADLEAIRGAKEKLKEHIQDRQYREMRHQAALTAHLDFAALEASRSFRHLRACLDWLRAHDGTGPLVYPTPPPP